MVARQHVGDWAPMSMEPQRIPKVIGLIAFSDPKRKGGFRRFAEQCGHAADAWGIARLIPLSDTRQQATGLTQHFTFQFQCQQFRRDTRGRHGKITNQLILGQRAGAKPRQNLTV
jgi:hypothetical protein